LEVSGEIFVGSSWVLRRQKVRILLGLASNLEMASSITPNKTLTIRIDEPGLNQPNKSLTLKNQGIKFRPQQSSHLKQRETGSAIPQQNSHPSGNGQPSPPTNLSPSPRLIHSLTPTKNSPCKHSGRQNHKTDLRSRYTAGQKRPEACDKEPGGAHCTANNEKKSKKKCPNKTLT